MSKTTKTMLKKMREQCLIPMLALNLQAKKNISAVCHHVFNDIFTGVTTLFSLILNMNFFVTSSRQEFDLGQ